MLGSTERQAPSITESFQEYGRGLAGGLMFSLPLLYTMEMWWAGFIATPLRLIGLLAFTYVLLFGYNRFAGMHRDATWSEVAIDSVEELGLGVVTAATVLFLLGRIGPEISALESLGKVVVEAAVVAIGFSIGTAQLHAGSDDGGGKENEPTTFGGELVIAFCGAIVFAANVAPTEEIPMIAVTTHPLRLLGLTLLSLATTSVVLYFTEFTRSQPLKHRDGAFDVVFGSVTTYACALMASGLILWFFGRFDGVDSGIAVRQIIVLGFPAALGASAGRLLISK